VSAREFNSGDTIDRNGRYTVLALLGLGGMAAVYRVRDGAAPTGQPAEVALKLLLPEGAASEVGRTRFMQEFEQLRAINDDRIVRVFERGETERQEPFFTMQLVSGATMKSVVAEGAPAVAEQRILPIEHVVALLLEIARAVEAVHSARVLYLDLKPSNILLIEERDELRACLIDFGIAQAISDAEHVERESTGTFVGTSLYMSPEQVRGSALNVRSDIYSFGVVAFELCTGRLPFDRETVFDVAASHLLGKVPELRSFNKRIPSRLEQVVQVCLSKEPGDRYESMSDVIDRLERIAKKNTPTGIARLLRFFGAR
jgi:serine/threonine protein kinase